MRQESDRLKGDNVSNEVLTEPEILALLEAEFPADKVYPWHKLGTRFVGRSSGRHFYCEAWPKDMWIVGLLVPDGVVFAGDGYGLTIPAAIADFRQRVLAEATAVGAVKANPTSDHYNNVEAAIFASFYQYAYTNSHTPSEAIDAATNAVEEYRATFK